MSKGILSLAAVVVALFLTALGLGVLGTQGPARAGAFPGKNGKIAYAYDTGGGNYEVYAMNPSGSGKRPLAPGRNPSFSSDGTRIAYDSGNDIWTMNADGTGKRQLTTNQADNSDPTYSPGGKKIAFISRRGIHDTSTDTDNLWIMNSDGTNPTRLTTGGASQPAYSPDGTKIAFTQQSKQRSGFELMVVDLGTGQQTQYTVAADKEVSDAGSPTFSPDGGKIEFTGIGGPAITCSCFGLYSVSSGGGTITTITQDNLGITDLAFSPDGTKLVAKRYSDNDIYTMAPNEAGATDVTNTAAEVRTPDWGVAPTAQSTTLSLAANPTSIASGQVVTLSGKLTVGNGRLYGGQGVTVQQKVAGTSSYTNLKTVRSDFDGTFKTTTKPTKNTYYRAVYGGNNSLKFGSAQSAARLVKVN